MAEDHDENIDALEDVDDLELEEEEVEGDEPNDEDEPDEDDDKPLTGKALRDALKGFKADINKTIDGRFSKSRKEQKPSNKPYKPDQNKDGKAKPWEADINEMKQAENKRQFGYENGLSPKEVDLVFKYDPKPTNATLKDPFVEGGLERLRTQAGVSKNIPRGSSARTVKINGKTWDEMKPDEKKANIVERRKAILEAKRNR